MLNKFLLVLKPLMNEDKTASVDPSSVDKRSESDVYSCLPMTYFNLPVLRTFMPLSHCSATSSYSNFDTVLCEVRKSIIIHVVGCAINSSWTSLGHTLVDD